MSNILLIEDDPRVASFISKGLQEKAFQVNAVANGMNGIDEALAFPYEIIILDIMLPDMSGFEVCKILRRRKNISPIIILSALDSPDEKVEGLQAGADDYLSKPFLFDELLARIQAQLRRVEFNKGIVEVQSYGGVVINTDEQNATRDGQALALSPLEYRLLLYLMRNREKALSRIQIGQSVWNTSFDTNTNTVDVYINFLRKKIDKGFDQPLIHTIKGTGYMFKMKQYES
ncbi:two-component system copper resistance phosphate regulon response regulator CusR [Chitinophaga skermanii]|uniref:Two-component system copper resistance phosphate regulon response regulator CusR n=1 Tax=Chitinophaga skermanii TaxID=331697 RepID=A0A327QLJ6_9BACT|nr:response regulator transcription factor [Chitinophaga skermanii]RAJ05419.1 two-component system copper resistance phosphate regulon response regulator CusR [Chitinophaga skermanii]